MNDISVGNILETDGERLLVAVRNLLEAKGLLTTAELAERRAITDAANPGQGARMVAKAWTDPAYRAVMLSDGAKAAEALGIPMRGMPPLGVLEDTSEVHNLVVCTLCSCYPRAAIRRSGSNPLPTAPARCVTRAACWQNGVPTCRQP